MLTKQDLRLIDSMHGKIIQVFNNLLGQADQSKINMAMDREFTDFEFDERQRKIILSDSAGGLRIYNMANGEFIEEISNPDELKTLDDGLTLYERA